MMKNISRRDMLTGFAAGAASAAGALQSGCAQEGISAAGPEALPTWRNEEFYKDGKLDAEATKQAYYTLMACHGFPIFPVLKTDEFWTLDFALGKFTEVGMGGIFYINNKRDNYMLHDIWLLPGQMIPEHIHVRHEDVAPKMEAWLVRHGMAYIYSFGKGTAEDEERIPATHRKIALARKAAKTLPGQVVRLEVAEQQHWMLAGPQGAIVTEVATYHSMEALRFTHPNIKL